MRIIDKILIFFGFKKKYLPTPKKEIINPIFQPLIGKHLRNDSK